MSVQILDNIDSEQKDLRDKARIELAQGLLVLYSPRDPIATRDKKAVKKTQN